MSDEDQDDLMADEAEEVDEEESDDGPARKKKRRNPFVDAEAGVDDDDDDDDGVREELIDDDELDAAEQEALLLREQRRMESRGTFEEERSPEEIVRALQERHRSTEYGGNLNAFMAPTELEQRALLPTVHDPKLWLIKCRRGQEQQLAVSVMNKYFAVKRKGTPMHIKSIVALSHLSGYIYIEADREAHVRAAVQGLRGLFAFNVKLVPINEMQDVLTIKSNSAVVNEGDWVRLKLGLYRGDIAQVYRVDSSGSNVHVKLVPRINLKKLEAQANGEELPKKRKRNDRPPQKFFNHDEIARLSNMHEIRAERNAFDDRVDVFQGNRYMDGYLVKEMKITGLEVAGVIPTLGELQQFQSGNEEEGSNNLGLPSVGSIKRQQGFSKGDQVIVMAGDLANLVGIVTKVDGDQISMMPELEELDEEFEFDKKDLRKFVKVGAHVKVTAGKYEGDTGHVVRVDDDKAVVFSDLSMKEFKVWVDYLHETTEVTTGLDSIGEYGLHDLVAIDQHMVGCIVKVERDSFKVLDTAGVVRTVKASEIGDKKRTRRTVCLDAHQNTIGQMDVVKVLDGINKSMHGTVKHVFRTFVFLHSETHTENSGIFVLRSRMVALLGGRTKQTASDGSTYDSSTFASPGSYLRHNPQQPKQNGFLGGGGQASRGGGRGGRGGRGRGRGQFSHLIFKKVKIVRGPFKGYAGQVVAASDQLIRVELTAQKRTVSLRHSDLSGEVSTGTPAHPGMGPSHGAPPTPRNSDSGRTPSYSRAATPMRPNTPGWTFNEAGDEEEGYDPAEQPTPYSASPFPSAPTPSDNPATPAFAYTPHDGSGNTPYDPNEPSTPYDPGSTPYEAYTPAVSPNPQTPGVPETPLNPMTPGGGDDTESSLQPMMEVQVCDPSHTHDGEIGIVLNPDGPGGSCEVNFPARNERVFIGGSSLDAVQPGKKDNVVVLAGAQKGQHGVLMQIDKDDAVIKIGEAQKIIICKMGDLGKLAT